MGENIAKEEAFTKEFYSRPCQTDDFLMIERVQQILNDKNQKPQCSSPTSWTVCEKVAMFESLNTQTGSENDWLIPDYPRRFSFSSDCSSSKKIEYFATERKNNSQ
ncbi:Oidioi.mRNA.OKI2018_I69.chr1.g146.t1.cds [Oikopleura dioica]|uniref:Oidioi.mRNA.OKI2018_I69.chr1.g146.t1.cds n=1 Tax=Oikopleura dioica TaxID=34765 RepID=A0ABN7SJF5_OIKDI|nr:Oidioi.mRNA.OKI2018_I69.chr1.g146.t1.cds [Oikopleura dioica]